MNPSQKGISAYFKSVRSPNKNHSTQSFHETGLLESEPLQGDVQLPTGRQNPLSFQAVLKTQLRKQG